VPPDLDLAGGERLPARIALHTALSEDIAALLQDAEHRVGQLASSQGSAREAPTPEERVDAVLPPDVLAALEERLEDDSEEDEIDSDEVESRLDPDTGSTTGTGQKETTGHSKDDSTGLGKDPGTSADRGPEVVAAARGALEPGGTAITDSGRTAVGSRATSTGIQTTPPEPLSAEPTGDEGNGVARAEKQQAATPKPPRPGARPTPDSEPPPTPRPPVFSEAPRTVYESHPVSDAPHSIRSQTQADSNRDASTAPPPSRISEPPLSAMAPQTISTSPPLRP
jgi:hypothetical protein